MLTHHWKTSLIPLAGPGADLQPSRPITDARRCSSMGKLEACGFLTMIFASWPTRIPGTASPTRVNKLLCNPACPAPRWLARIRIWTGRKSRIPIELFADEKIPDVTVTNRIKTDGCTFSAWLIGTVRCERPMCTFLSGIKNEFEGPRFLPQPHVKNRLSKGSAHEAYDCTPSSLPALLDSIRYIIEISHKTIFNLDSASHFIV